jgi:hypothetical protein
LHHFSTTPKQELYRISLIEKKTPNVYKNLEVIMAVMPEWGEA